MAIIQTTSLPYPSKEKVTTTFAVGTTLTVTLHTYQVMSDIWESGLRAEYWNEEKGCVETADWCDSGTKADATAEVIAKAKQWLYDRVYSYAIEKRTAKAAAEVREIVKGCRVRVTSGRSGKGTEGLVAIAIERPYGMGYRSSFELKLGIATSEVKVKVAASNGRVYDNYRDVVWAWARNCERIDIPAIDLESIKEGAAEDAAYEVKGRRWG